MSENYRNRPVSLSLDEKFEVEGFALEKGFSVNVQPGAPGEIVVVPADETGRDELMQFYLRFDKP